jgi:cysteine-rich repeat protein
MCRTFLTVTLFVSLVWVPVETEAGNPSCGVDFGEPVELWPPDHRMVEVDLLNASGAWDPDGGLLELTVLSITQDEPVNGAGDGNTAPDGAGVGTGVAHVRRERSGRGNGRVYEITFEARDGTDGSCTGQVHVAVPKSRNRSSAMDDGQVYDSTSEHGTGLIVCGDGIAGPGEECDDGNPQGNPNDGCDPTCKRTQWAASLVSGYGPSGGDPTNLVLSRPRALAFDAGGNLYVASRDAYQIIKIAPSGLSRAVAGTGVRCTDAAAACGDGGEALSAQLGEVEGMAIDSRLTQSGA